MRQTAITPQYVEFIPDQLQDGVLYISEQYKTAIHKCCCGCGSEVVTPLTPADWRIRKEGGTVTLYPSIGNWGFPCQSHYWIRKNRIEWARTMTKQQISRVQARDKRDKERYIAQINANKSEKAVYSEPQNLWLALKKWWHQDGS